MQQIIQTTSAPAAIGAYSQAIKIGNTLYLAGQIPLDPATMQLVSDDIQVQVTQVFKNMSQVLEAAHVPFDAIVKLTVYLLDISHISVVNEVMTQYFKKSFPARTSIAVVALPKNARIEIDAIAAW